MASGVCGSQAASQRKGWAAAGCPESSARDTMRAPSEDSGVRRQGREGGWGEKGPRQREETILILHPPQLQTEVSGGKDTWLPPKVPGEAEVGTRLQGGLGEAGVSLPGPPSPPTLGTPPTLWFCPPLLL